MLAERFGSSGKFSVVELEKSEPAGLRPAKAALAPGTRVKVIGRYGEGEIVEKAEEASWRILFDDGVEAIVLADRICTDLAGSADVPKVDTRTLYEKLKETKDAKQEEWEHKHTFKNQMDHWRLDEDDAAFESERVERLQADADKQRMEADEDLMRFQAAMYSRTKKLEGDPVALPSPALPINTAEQGAHAGAKRKSTFLAVKVVPKKGREQPPREPAAPAPSAASRTPPPTVAAPCSLPGMAAYDDEEESEENR